MKAQNKKDGLQLFWGDAHTNLHGKDVRHALGLTQERLKRTLEAARQHLDFFPIAYYPFVWYEKKGLINESCGPRDQFDEDWKRVQKAIAEANRPSEFVTFLGYEWHGDRRRYGDHNVYYLEDYQPLDASETLPQLYQNLRKTKAIVIPHHTAYQVGERGKNWDFHDDRFSPFAEIYSGHGSSEGCNTPFTLQRNISMGPRTSGGTVQEGLERGYRLGIIASGDNHADFPGVWGRGLMAAYAKELTRGSLWEAFMRRRVYGVTGDRIKLKFFINGRFMGESFTSTEPVEVHAEIEGSHAIDRVEIIRNGRVLHTYCHSGRWNIPHTNRPIRAKLRIECCGGPGTQYGFKTFEEKIWNGFLEVEGGKIVSLEPYFTYFGQKMRLASEGRCEWVLTARRRDEIQGIIFEIEAPLKSEIVVKADSEEAIFSLEDALRKSRIMALLNEAKKQIEEQFGISPREIENPDIYWHIAHKLNIHKAVPQEGYEVKLTYVDSDPPKRRNYYYLRVSQLNGQMAWSSPIWVKPTP